MSVSCPGTSRALRKLCAVFFGSLAALSFAQTAEDPLDKTAAQISSVYRSVAGRDLRIFEFAPSGASGNARPAILFVQGGAWSRGRPEQLFRPARLFADKGFVSVVLEYRLGHKTNSPRESFSDCPCPWNPYPIADSRIGFLGLSRMPVLLEPHRADVRQRGVQPGAVVPEYPGDDLVLGLAPRHEALPMQSLHLQRTEQGLAAGVVPAVALAAHRGRDAALGEHVPEVLAGVLAAPVAVEDQPGMLARMALEPGHA